MAVIAAAAWAGTAEPAPRPTAWDALPEAKLDGDTIATARHVITLAPTGLPAQIAIQADPRELPPAARNRRAEPLAEADLLAIGRGPQLRAPLRIEVSAEGRQAEAKPVAPAKPEMRDGAVRCEARLAAGPVAIALSLRYERDGALFGAITCGAEKAKVESLTLVADLGGPVDQIIIGQPVAASLRAYEPRHYVLSGEEGLVWGNAPGEAEKGGPTEPGPVTHLFVGSGDRGFTWLAQSGGWLVDEKLSAATLTRDQEGRATLRLHLINHAVTVQGEQTLAFALLTHPATFRPAEVRRRAWLAWPVEGEGQPMPLTLEARRGAERSVLPLLRADAATVFESLARHSLLSGVAGGDALSLKRNHAETWPMGLFRYLAGTHTGLVSRLRSNASALSRPGMSPATDRVLLARALLHDIGLDASRLAHLAGAARVLAALERFGLFEGDGDTEFIPYWRSETVARFGERFGSEGAFELAEKNPLARAYVSLYLRPAGRGRARKALIVIANDGPTDVRDQLYVLDPHRVFGGANRLERKAVISQYDFSAMGDTTDWGKPGLLGRSSHRTKYVLQDLEDGGIVGQPVAKRGLEAYGPFIHVPAHSFRLLYGTGAR